MVIVVWILEKMFESYRNVIVVNFFFVVVVFDGRLLVIGYFDLFIGSIEVVFMLF